MKKQFLITGASKGIGLALASRLARESHEVVGVAHSSKDGFPGRFHTINFAASYWI